MPLMPKRVKFRKQQRGKIRGVAAILRREKIRSGPTPRWALAGRFDQPLDLDFK